MRRSLAGLPGRLRARDHDLQSLEPMEQARDMDAHSGRTDRGGLDSRNRADRQQLCEGAPVFRRRKRGARAQAIGTSRGGRTTKIHALVDLLGRPLRLVLTPGNTSDIKGADLLLGDTAGMKRLIADRGYDANRLRATLRDQGTIPVIPGRRNRKRPIQYDQRRYRDRWRVEAMFCRLKDFRRIATRYDKLARNFLSAISLAAAVAFWL